MPGLAFTIAITGTAPDSVRMLAAGLAPERLNPIVGRSARNTYREHLFGLNGQKANRLGGPRTNFYTGAGRATQFRVEGDHVIVSINQVGIAQRYFGGTIKPKTKKFLTIPARAEAHGHRASEFDLVVLFNRSGPYALAKRRQARSSRGFIGPGIGRGAEVMFWLVKSVTQQPDPTVLPYPELVGAQAARAVDKYATRLWARQPPSTGGDS